jgi:hypothetical protein
MEKIAKRFICGVIGIAMVTAFFVPMADAFPSKYAAWNKYYNNTVFKFWYKSTDTYGQNIASKLAKSYEWGYRPFSAAGQVLGVNPSATKPSGYFDVLIDPKSSYNSGGYSGHFWFTTGNTSGLKGQYIYMSSGQSSTSTKNMYNYACMLSHELSHMLYMNYTKGYTMSWFWNASYNGFKRDRALTESLAYYTGSVYYPPTAYKMTAATIKSQVKGYVALVEDAAYRYTHTGFTSKDWYLFHAFGYYLASTGKVGTLINKLRYYIAAKSNYAFQYAYQNTFSKNWADWIAASTQKSNSSYLYYGFYRAWIM